MTFSGLSPRRRFALVVAAFLVLFLTGVMQSESPATFMSSGGVDHTFSVSGHHRKLLLQRAAEVEPNRIWGDKCSRSDIVINQGPTAPLPSGIPTYTVEIMNVCVTGCDISGIHLSCGWFSSARLINPHIFKRLQFDDCIVNDGKPLLNGRTISFQYANTFPYKLSVTSVAC